MIRKLLPATVVVVETKDPPQKGTLHPDESVLVSRAVAKRKREFTAGRLCAREALEQLGIANFPIVSGRDRAPVWPKGFVGSISHCDGYCAAAVARCEDTVGVGIDVEKLRPLEAALVRRICSPSELRSAAEVPELAGERAPLAIFSAKESAYKCYYPAASTVLEHADLEVHLDRDGRFEARLTREELPAADGARCFEGRFAIDSHYVYTAVVLG